MGINIELKPSPALNLSLSSANPLNLDLGQGGSAGVRDYEKLKNKPAINGRTIIGDKTVAYYLQDGLILNGGDSTGYPAPVIPPGVPSAEGVMF